MRLGLRLLFGFLLITGLAGFFVLRVFLAEVKPSVREVMEDLMVDTANLLAESATADLAAMPPGGTLEGSAFARQVRDYAARPVDAQIWGLHKRSLDFRIYVTDASGRVVFDSGEKPAVGQDYSRWRDVARTLRGEYGARATRELPADDSSSVMHVAAPVKQQGQLLGVVTVAKPMAAVAQFIERAERKILWSGAWLLGLSMLVGVAVTLWTVHAVRRLRRYAQQVGDPQADAEAVLRPPELPGELGELAQAMDRMRQRLAGRQRLEQDVRALTHELKAPMTAIQGAAELLRDDLAPADRARFAQQIEAQVDRQRELVDRVLALSRLESQRAPPHPEPVDLVALTEHWLAQNAALLAQRGLQAVWAADGRDRSPVHGDAEQIAMAFSNVLLNACQHAPAGSALALSVRRQGRQLLWSVRDQGPGVPAYALPQLGHRFFATANPVDGRKGSGLGLAIVHQVMALHGGSWRAEPAQPGLQLTLLWPLGRTSH
jgi:two-component system sensor histidine kinase CreC